MKSSAKTCAAKWSTDMLNCNSDLSARLQEMYSKVCPRKQRAIWSQQQSDCPQVLRCKKAAKATRYLRVTSVNRKPSLREKLALKIMDEALKREIPLIAEAGTLPDGTEAVRLTHYHFGRDFSVFEEEFLRELVHIVAARYDCKSRRSISATLFEFDGDELPEHISAVAIDEATEAMRPKPEARYMRADEWTEA